LADLSRIASERVRQVLTMLVDEAGFLELLGPEIPEQLAQLS
jgi:hypothetical protein